MPTNMFISLILTKRFNQTVKMTKYLLISIIKEYYRF